jgi:hypothetical protein
MARRTGLIPPYVHYPDEPYLYVRRGYAVPALVGQAVRRGAAVGNVAPECPQHPAQIMVTWGATVTAHHPLELVYE